MEFAGKANGGGSVAGIGFMLQRDVLLEQLDVPSVILFRKPRQDLTLQAHAGFEDVVRFRQARLRNGGPLLG